MPARRGRSRRSVAIVGTFAVAAAALLVSCDSDRAQPPELRSIAYVRHFGFGRSELRFVRNDGRGQRRLARGFVVEALLSPDGRWVAYVSCARGHECYDLYVVSTRGGAPRRLARSTWPTEWSRDSSFLLAKPIEDSTTTRLVKVDATARSPR